MTDPILIVSPHVLTLAQDAPTQAPPIAGLEGGGTAAAQPGTQGAEGAQAPPPMGGFGFMWVFVGLFLVMILMQVFAGRKEKKRRAEMLSSVARHDRVQTVGGLIGTVSEVKGDEVVVKIDEATNTKVRVVRSAIQQVLKKSGEAETSEPVAVPEKIAS
jgi:preprotein translocase subunit YajC